MAKLTNVKTVDMVNGEITKVAYDGAEYAKVEGNAKIGDLVISNGKDKNDLTSDAFYVVIEVDTDGDIEVYDDVNDDHGLLTHEFEGPYRKISAEPSPTLEERVTELETEVATLKSGDSSLKGKANGTIEFEGATYRKVDREAREGDVVILTKYSPYNFTEGKLYQVQKYARIKDIDGDLFSVYNPLTGRTRETVDVYEAQYIPQVGDIVVITENTNYSCNAIGEVGKVVEGPTRSGGYRVEVEGRDKRGNISRPNEIRKATPAEVEQYEKAAHKASFAVGDYVKIVKSYVGYEGEIAKITEIGKYHTAHGVCDYIIEHSPKKVGRFAVKAEQIVKATDAEIARATAPKLKAGDFVVYNDTDELPYDTTAGKSYEVNADDDGDLYIIDDVSDRNYGAIADFKYEIVDAETAKWAKLGRKVNEFKEGDSVFVTHPDGGKIYGIIHEDSCGHAIKVDFGKQYRVCTEDKSDLTLVAPVESTVA